MPKKLFLVLALVLCLGVVATSAGRGGATNQNSHGATLDRFVVAAGGGSSTHPRGHQICVTVAFVHSPPAGAANNSARLTIGFQPNPPRNGTEALDGVDPSLDRLIHLYFLNRGILVTPFHNMLLISPDIFAIIFSCLGQPRTTNTISGSFFLISAK